MRLSPVYALIMGFAVIYPLKAQADYTHFVFLASSVPFVKGSLVLVAQKAPKKRRRSITYATAWKVCKQKYGKENVINVKIKTNGKIICYVDMWWSEGAKKNYNK